MMIAIERRKKRCARLYVGGFQSIMLNERYQISNECLSRLSDDNNDDCGDGVDDDDDDEDEEGEIQDGFEQDSTTSRACTGRDILDDDDLSEIASTVSLEEEEDPISPIPSIRNEEIGERDQTLLRPHQYERLSSLGRVLYTNGRLYPNLTMGDGEYIPTRRLRRNSVNLRMKWRKHRSALLSPETAEDSFASLTEQQAEKSFSSPQCISLARQWPSSFSKVDVEETDSPALLDKERFTTEFQSSALLRNASKKGLTDGNIPGGGISVAVPLGHDPGRIANLGMLMLSNCGYLCPASAFSSSSWKRQIPTSLLPRSVFLSPHTVEDNSVSLTKQLLEKRPNNNSGPASSPSLHVSLLLLDPRSRSFELKELSFSTPADNEEAATMARDILDGVPRYASKHVLRRQAYAGILRLLQNDDDDSTGYQTIPAGRNSKGIIGGGNFVDGDILVAIPSGHSPQRIANLSLSILSKCGYPRPSSFSLSSKRRIMSLVPRIFRRRRNEEKLAREGIPRAKEKAAAPGNADACEVDRNGNLMPRRRQDGPRRSSSAESPHRCEAQGLYHLACDDDVSRVSGAYSSWSQSFDSSFVASSSRHRLGKHRLGSFSNRILKERIEREQRRWRHRQRILKQIRLLAVGTGLVKAFVSSLNPKDDDDGGGPAAMTSSQDDAMGVRGAFVLILTFVCLAKLQERHPQNAAHGDSIARRTTASVGEEIPGRDLLRNDRVKDLVLEWSAPCSPSSSLWVSSSESCFNKLSDEPKRDVSASSWKVHMGTAVLVFVILAARYPSGGCGNSEPLLSTGNESMGIRGLCQCLALLCYMIKIRRLHEEGKESPSAGHTQAEDDLMTKHLAVARAFSQDGADLAHDASLGDYLRRPGTTSTTRGVRISLSSRGAIPLLSRTSWSSSQSVSSVGDENSGSSAYS